MAYDVSLIDVCLSCYLQDHHNRDGELLLSVPVDGTTTNAAVREELLSELQTCDCGESFDWDAARQAIAECFAGAEPDKLFDASLEVNEEDCDESCYAHFLLSYE